jgi:hypothetical protein
LAGNQTTIDKDEELDEKVAKLLAPQEIGAEKKKKKEKEKEKMLPEKKGATCASNVERPLARKEGKQKGGSVITQEDKKSSRKNGHGDVDIMLSGQEESVIDFLCTRGEKNGKANVSVSNGVHHTGEKKNGDEVKVDTALYDDEAVDIVFNFQRCVVPDSEVQQAKKWSKDNQPRESIPLISPVLKVDFASLPIEPEVNDLEAACMSTVDNPQLATEDAMDGKLGIDSLDDESPEFRIEVAKLNELAGMKAVVCSDYVTSRSYFTYALSLLPIDHWKCHYDISLRFTLRLAKSHYSCGDVEKAQSILQDMIGQCHSFEDKLPACELLAKSKMHAWSCSLEMCSPDFVLLTMAIVC